MTLIQILVLALVQGVTEFVPVSSSGHLVVVRELLGISDQGGLMTDIVLHAGSLLAVLIYFWRDWLLFLCSFTDPTVEDRDFYRSLPLLLIVATLPAVLVAPLLADAVEAMRKGWMVGVVMVLAAGWFVFCEIKRRETGRLGYLTALVMGVAQVFALLPGASRSGLTMSAGMLTGQRRERAARFAFFMVIPVILGAMVLKLPEILQARNNGVEPGLLAVGFGVCFLVSLGCIDLCLRLFRRSSLRPFAVYLAAVGLLLILKSFVC